MCAYNFSAYFIILKFVRVGQLVPVFSPGHFRIATRYPFAVLSVSADILSIGGPRLDSVESSPLPLLFQFQLDFSPGISSIPGRAHFHSLIFFVLSPPYFYTSSFFHPCPSLISSSPFPPCLPSSSSVFFSFLLLSLSLFPPPFLFSWFHPPFPLSLSCCFFSRPSIIFFFTLFSIYSTSLQRRLV